MQVIDQLDGFFPEVGGAPKIRPSAILMIWVVGLSLLLSVGTRTATQAQVKRLNLTEMVESAGTVVAGRVVEVREGHHPNYQNVAVTFITVEVDDVLKGNTSHQAQHTFMQFGGMGATRVSELPSYRVGEEAVVFLYPESEYGFTSVVGGGQGKFYMRTDPLTGERVLTSSIDHQKLFEGISLQKLSSAERIAVRKSEGPINYRTFASIVKKVLKK